MFEIIFEQKIIDFKDLKMLFMPVALIFILNGSVSSFILEKIRMKYFLDSSNFDFNRKFLTVFKFARQMMNVFEISNLLS